jgi:hypothetical protein
VCEETPFKECCKRQAKTVKRQDAQASTCCKENANEKKTTWGVLFANTDNLGDDV